MKLLNLLKYVLPIFVLLLYLWYLFEHYCYWLSQFVCICTFFVFSWIFGYTIYDLFERNKVKEPEARAVLITGCDSGFGHELAIKLDQFGKNIVEK